MRLWQRALTGLATAAAAAALAPAALADSPPALTLGQYNGTTSVAAGTATQAGSTANLDLDLTFAGTTDATTPGQDTPENLTINLPPGLLTNTSITDSTGAACITDPAPASGAPDSDCQVGTGTVNALIEDGISLPVAVEYYLVAPPSPGDLAGLQIYSSELGAALGSPGDVLIRPTGDPDGVGATIKLTVPNSALGVLPIAVTSIDSTFDNLRFPATCSSQSVTVTNNSYDDPGTIDTTNAPLLVSGCDSLTYNPQFSASATRDPSDNGVAVTTDITQGATEAPNQSVALGFPTSMFSPDLASLQTLCANPASGTCTAVGSVSATSPLYPDTLTGKAYLSGNANGPTLILVFPAPFPLTLTGTVNLVTDTAAFTGLPDIPLSDLKVTLDGGAQSLFVTNCQAASGSATAGLTGQNGASVSRTASISYAGCPADNPPVGSASPSTPLITPGTAPAAKPATAKLVSRSIGGLKSGKPSLSFKVSAPAAAAKLTRVTVRLPSGLSFRSADKKVSGITLKGAKAKSAKLSGGRLVITFKAGSRKVTVKLGAAALKESKALRAKAEKRSLKSLKLRLTTRNAQGRTKALSTKVMFG